MSDDMKDEYEFSCAERGRFYRKGRCPHDAGGSRDLAVSAFFGGAGRGARCYLERPRLTKLLKKGHRANRGG